MTIMDSFFKGVAQGHDFYNQVENERLDQARKRLALYGLDNDVTYGTKTNASRIAAALAQLNNMADLNRKEQENRQVLNPKKLIADSTGYEVTAATNRYNHKDALQKLGVLDSVGVAPRIAERQSELAARTAQNQYSAYDYGDRLTTAQQTEEARRKMFGDQAEASANQAESNKIGTEIKTNVLRNNRDDIEQGLSEQTQTDINLGRAGFLDSEQQRQRAEMDSAKRKLVVDAAVNGIFGVEGMRDYLNRIDPDSLTPVQRIAVEQMLTEDSAGIAMQEAQQKVQNILLNPAQAAAEMGMILDKNPDGSVKVDERGEITVFMPVGDSHIAMKTTLTELQSKLASSIGMTDEHLQKMAENISNQRARGVYGTP